MCCDLPLRVRPLLVLQHEPRSLAHCSPVSLLRRVALLNADVAHVLTAHPHASSTVRPCPLQTHSPPPPRGLAHCRPTHPLRRAHLPTADPLASSPARTCPLHTHSRRLDADIDIIEPSIMVCFNEVRDLARETKRALSDIVLRLNSLEAKVATLENLEARPCIEPRGSDSESVTSQVSRSSRRASRSTGTAPSTRTATKLAATAECQTTEPRA